LNKLKKVDTTPTANTPAKPIAKPATMTDALSNALLNFKLNKKQEMDFLNRVERTKTKKNSQIQSQLGGRKRYDGKKDSSESVSLSSSSKSKSSESDESSSDDDDAYFNFTRYKRMNQPIVYWNYTPTIYRVTKFFTPTFNVPLMPYIHIYNPKL
jgi:hypothetical protein